MQDLIFSDLNTFQSPLLNPHSSPKLWSAVTLQDLHPVVPGGIQVWPCSPGGRYAGMRVAASSSASALLALISASVRPKRVHSSPRGTAICWDTDSVTQPPDEQSSAHTNGTALQ